MMVSCLLTFLALAASAQSLNNPLRPVNNQLRGLFSPLSKPSPVLGYLYDMSGHVTDEKFWTHYSKDTSSSDNWYMMYWEHYYMAYDTSSLERDTSIYEKELDYGRDTISIGVLDKSFYKLKPDALTSPDYFIFDVDNDILYDIPGRPEEPYFWENVFAAAPLFDRSRFGEITWAIDPDKFFVDLLNDHYYNPNNYRFEVDFGDGAGFVLFDPNVLTYHTIDYSAIANSGDDIFIDVRITQDGMEVKYSRSRFRLGDMDLVIHVPDETIQFSGLNIAVYRACNSTPQDEKAVIYLEGIDILDFETSFNRTADQVYSEMIDYPYISQLRNYGYDFYVVDWANSRIDMTINAMNVVMLLDSLKGAIDNDHEFIIMGESMGGVIARYALTFMESPSYLNPVNFPNANERERMHNCRQMFTIDSPHQGASIPLSMQHLYDVIATSAGSIFGTPMLGRKVMSHYNMFLDSKAAKQLLIYHVDTKSGWGQYKNYSEHQDRTDFMNDLQNLGDYPSHCKKIALSNGALNGTKQCRFYTEVERVANDFIFDFDMDLYATILWFVKVPILGADLELLTNPDGQGKVFQMNAGVWDIQIKFHWFGANLITGYNSLYNKTEYAEVEPYCVNAGGYFGSRALDPLIGNSPNTNEIWRLSTNWGLTLARITEGTDVTGCWNTKAQVGLDAVASINFDLSICSDGLHFGFIPVQSALDYGTLGTVDLDHDFEDDLINSPGLVQAMTPFDLIVAQGKDDEFPPLSLDPAKLNRSHLYVKYQGKSSYLENEFPMFECNPGTGIHGNWINREIGDDILFLDNLDCARSSTFEARFQLYVNTFNNPWYTYANGNVGSHPGFFSKANHFEIRDNENAEFRYDFPMFTQTGGTTFAFNPSPNQGVTPFQGTWNVAQSGQMACSPCVDFSKTAPYAEPLLMENELLEPFAEVYPNPLANAELNVRYQFTAGEPVSVMVTNLSGQVVYTHTLPPSDESASTAMLPLHQASLSSGVYIVRFSSGSETISARLMVQ